MDELLTGPEDGNESSVIFDGPNVGFILPVVEDECEGEYRRVTSGDVVRYANTDWR